MLLEIEYKIEKEYEDYVEADSVVDAISKLAEKHGVDKSAIVILWIVMR